MTSLRLWRPEDPALLSRAPAQSVAAKLAFLWQSNVATALEHSEGLLVVSGKAECGARYLSRRHWFVVRTGIVEDM